MKTPAPQRAAGRKKLAKAGDALADGSFPIPDVAYLKKAIRSVGRAPASKRPALKSLINKRAKALGATSVVKGTWADPAAKAMANDDSEALEMAMPARRMPVVRGPADVQASRSAPGVISVMHKSTGTRVGVINSVPGGYQPVHASGKTLPVQPQMAPAMAGLIAWHNKMAAQKAATAQAMSPAAPAAVAPMAKAYANDGAALEFVGPEGYVHGWIHVGADSKGAKLAVGDHITVGARGSSRSRMGKIIGHDPDSGKVKVLQQGTKKTFFIHPKQASKLNDMQVEHMQAAESEKASAAAAKKAARARSMSNADDQEALDFAGAIPVTTSGDGPRITSMAGGKKGKTVPAAKLSMAAQGTSGGMTAEVAKVYAKLIKKGLSPKQAMAFAKRAAAMHAKAVAKKAA